MRKGWLRLFPVLVLFVIYSFFPVLANAQAQPSKASLQTKADGLFNTYISELQAKQNNPRSQSQLTSASDAEVTRYVQANKGLIFAIQEGQKTFTQYFNQPAAQSINVYADFTAALNAASTRLNSIVNGSTTVRTVAMIIAEQRRVSSQINNLAQERQQELINTGQGDAAVGMQNAVADQRNAQAAKENKERSTCSLVKWSIVDCADQVLNWFVKNVLLNFAGVFLWLTANIFNYSISLGILNFSQWASPTLYPLWTIIRQMTSLVMVFVGLYLGFMYILGKQAPFERYIPWVVMFALFVNFSYPLTRAMVDVSNIVSLKIYTATMGTEVLNPNASISSSHTPGAIIASRMGFGGLLVSASKDQSGNGVNVLKNLNSTPASLAAVFFVLYACYVFFTAAVLIAGRTAALVFLTIASPLLLIDSVLPLLGEKAKVLRKVFLEQLAVGPVFMVMLALTLKFLEVFRAGPLGDVGTGSDATIKTFFNLVIMIIMLHITLKVTKELSGEIGKQVTEKLGTVGGFALGGAAAGTGMLARAGIGRLATKARDSAWVKNNQDSFMGRRAYNLTNSLANSTFDLRNSSVVAGASQKLGMSKGMGWTGKGAANGYEKQMELKKKDIVDRAQRIDYYYKEDIFDKDEKGNVKVGADGKPVILHKKGEVDLEAKKAQERYYETAGGNRFMTKKEKEDVREQLKAKSREDLAKTEKEVSKYAEENLKEYSSIKGDIKNPDGSIITAAQQRERELKKLEAELLALRQRDPNMMGIEAQSLVRAIDKIKIKERESSEAERKKKEDESKAFEDKISELVFRHDNFRGTPEEIRKKQDKLIEGMDKKTREAFNAKIKEGHEKADPAKQTPLTGEDLRKQRLEKVAAGRAENVQAYKEAAERDLVEIKQYNDIKTSINEKYDQERAELLRNGQESSILGPDGKPIKKQPSEESLQDIERRRRADLLKAEVDFSKTEAYRYGELDATILEEAKAKQAASAERRTNYETTGTTRKINTIAVDPTIPDIDLNDPKAGRNQNIASVGAASQAMMANRTPQGPTSDLSQTTPQSPTPIDIDLTPTQNEVRARDQRVASVGAASQAVMAGKTPTGASSSINHGVQPLTTATIKQHDFTAMLGNMQKQMQNVQLNSKQESANKVPEVTA